MNGVVSEIVDSSMEDLLALFKKATPSQIKLVTALITAALDVCDS